MLEWIKGLIGGYKERVYYLYPPDEEPHKASNISEPVYTIAKATENVKRWKIYCNGYYVTCTDKLTTREFKLSLDSDSYWRGFSPYHNVLSRFWDGDKFFGSYDIDCDPFKPTPLILGTYSNVFNAEEQDFLSKAFSELWRLKLKQAEKVYQHRVYLNDKRKAEAESRSIRMGIELREKMMEEYCEIH